MSIEHNSQRPGSSQRAGFFSSVHFKMILYFGLVAGVAMVALQLVDFYGLPFIDYDGSIKENEDRVLRGLDLVADLKKERLLRWMEERNDDIEVLAESAFAREYVAGLRGIIKRGIAQGKGEDALWQQVEGSAAHRAMEKHLELVKATYGVYREIAIADKATGLVMASTHSIEDFKSAPLEPCFSEIVNPDGVCVRLGKDSSSLGRPVLIVARSVDLPDGVVDGGGEERAAAVLLAYVDTRDFIEPLLHTGGRLGASGESFLVDRRRRILVPLKHLLADGSRAVPLEYEITADAATFAARGEEGIVISEDYRGEPVLAAYRHVRITPQVGWGMVVKIDIAEAFAPLRTEMRYTNAIVVIGSMLGFLVVGLLAYRITRPVRLMAEAARRVREGDLTARAPVSSVDEVGLLAGTFNSMIERVEDWTKDLEFQVENRTALLMSAYQELQESENQLIEAQKIANAGSWRIDLAKREIHMSEEAYRIFGLQPDEFEPTYEALLSLIHPDDTEFVRASIKQALEDGASFDAVFRIVRPGGEIRHVHTRSKEIMDEAGKVTYSVGSVQDITERRRWEEEIRSKNLELEHLLHVASHDLREPLRSISNFAHLVNTQYYDRLDQKGRDYLQRVVRGTGRMRSLIDDLLMLSRARSVEPPEREWEGSAIVHDALKRLDQMIVRTGAKIRVEDGLPRLKADRVWATQAVYNLVANALKFSRDGEAPEVEIGGYRREGEAGIVVRDRGPGVPPGQAERIFELFKRGVGREVEGTGAGLAIVRAVAQRHRGRAWVQVREGGGSEFFITFSSRLPQEGRVEPAAD